MRGQHVIILGINAYHGLPQAVTVRPLLVSQVLARKLTER